MPKALDVRELRREMGLSPDGGTAAPIAAHQLKGRVQVENEQDFGPRWMRSFADLPFRAQFVFDSVRDYRFDFCWPDEGVSVEARKSKGGVAIELQGGVWKHGKSRHNTGEGLTSSYEKLNLAAARGWLVFQLSDAMAQDRTHLEQIAATIRKRREVNS